MKCAAFKPLVRGSLQGFADLQMDSGLILLGCSLHSSNGKRWVNPPGRPQLDADKKVMLEAGKVLYVPIVDFADKKIRYKWSDAALAAIDEHLDGKTPATAGAMNGGTQDRSAAARGRDGS